jgi:glycosyltransferase involved in cell wall biosynthesis
MKVLVLQNYYLPGYLGGGGIRAVSNLVSALGHEFDFAVVCKDRDLGVAEPYVGIRCDEWSPVGPALVRYTKPQAVTKTIWRLLREPGHDVVYLNSIFERRFSIWPLLLRRTGLAREVPFVLAPHGELGSNSLLIRGRRKRAFLWVAARLGWFDRLTWHATSHTEVSDIERFLVDYGVNGGAVVRADDLVAVEHETVIRREIKQPGRARVVYLSRIVPKKNLVFALRVLRKVRSDVEFDIYGPREDSTYWKKCEEEIRQMPSNVVVRYRGLVAHKDVVGVLGGYDLFFFPTLNENFGYAIVEALRAGCPVLLTDQTPWGTVSESGAGWTLPLDAVQSYAEVIDEVAGRGECAQSEQSARAVDYASRLAMNSNAVEASRRLFESVRR